MSKKHETRVTEPERARLADTGAALQKATNTKNRAEIALATAQQDFNECLQDLGKRYKLGEKDGVNPATGEIVRASA